MVGIEDLDIADSLNVTGRHGTRTLLAHNHALGTVALHLDGDFLDVQHDVGHILADARDRREFMQNAVDLHRRHGSAAQRGQKNAAQRVAESEAEATLQRLGDEGRQRLPLRLKLDFVRLDQLLPIFLDHSFFLPAACHYPIVTANLENRRGAIARSCSG